MSTATRPSPAAPRSAAPEAQARSGASAASALGKTANGTSDGSRDRRDDAWRLRRRLWELSTISRVRACGRAPVTAGAGPVLRVNGGRAGFAGLQSCGSVWSCPVCARKIGARRAEQIREAVTAVDRLGGTCALVTFTLRHSRGDRLDKAWDALTYGWGRVCSGELYGKERRRWGILGWCAAVEVTRGDRHGWHPHRHVLVAFDGPMSQEMIEEAVGDWWPRFERAIGRRGFTAVAERGGFDVRKVAADSEALGVYLSKIALEVTGGSAKEGRFGNRTPFQLLRDGIATGLADDLEAWWTWEHVSRNRQQLTWARGFRQRLGLGQVGTDEEIAREDLGGDNALVLPLPTWEAVRDRAEDLLGAAERDGAAGAAAWLTVRGLDWSWATPAPRRPPEPRPHQRAPRPTPRPRRPRRRP